MKGYRKEKDSMGTVLVKNEHLWGAQTERSRTNFNIGQEEIPKPVIYALISLKKAAANVNTTEGKLSSEQRDGILAACELLQTGEYEEQFPLKVWQTGSGTQTNMNVNEVIACLSNKQVK
ncbi:lyase family protein, partial [Carnobacterium sp.]|uniref:lyase family protein n=1 Tax=Carnobacterium sp. TaxID=48221 RepID=UPI0028B220CD